MLGIFGKFGNGMLFCSHVAVGIFKVPGSSIMPECLKGTRHAFGINMVLLISSLCLIRMRVGIKRGKIIVVWCKKPLH